MKLTQGQQQGWRLEQTLLFQPLGTRGSPSDQPERGAGQENRLTDLQNAATSIGNYYVFD